MGRSIRPVTYERTDRLMIQSSRLCSGCRANGLLPLAVPTLVYSVATQSYCALSMVAGGTVSTLHVSGNAPLRTGASRYHLSLMEAVLLTMRSMFFSVISIN